MKPCMYIIIALAVLVHVVRADVDQDDIDRTFELEIGDRALCGFQIEIDDESLTLDASDIKVENDDCDGGTLTLSQNPKDATSAARFLISKVEAGNILAGSIDDQLTCNDFSLASGSNFIFFEPEDDFTVKWADLFNGESPLGNATDDDDFEFDDGTTYLIVNEDCLYRATSITDSVCFPSSATVQLKSGARIRMDHLSIGDQVLVKRGVYSPVIAWTHRDARASNARYTKIETAHGQKLVVTDSHYVYADMQMRQAASVRVGMTMETGDGDDTVVTKVSRVHARGLYNPQTAHGDIVVNGLVSSTYTSTVKPEIAHALLTPIRAVVKAGLCAASVLSAK